MGLRTLLAVGTMLLASACGDDDPTDVQDGQLVVQARPASAFASPGTSSVWRGTNSAAQVGDPSSFVVGFYRIYLASSPDCSSPILLKSDPDPSLLDLLDDPVLFTVSGPTGTYECVVMRISDVFSFIPATSFGPCTAGTTYQVDTYRTGETDFLDVDGSPVLGTGSDAAPSDDRVDIFFSTDPSAVVARGFSSNQVVTLVGGATVPGTSTFVYDVRGQVIDEGGSCRSGGGTYTFR